MAFNVETAKKEDVDSLSNFFRKMLGKNVTFLPQEKSDIINKYRKYESGSELLNISLLKDKNKNIVGCSGYVPFKGLLAGQKIDGFVGSDAIVDPSIRERFPTSAMLLAYSYEDRIRKDKLFPLVCPVNEEVSKLFKSVQWSGFGHIYKFTSNFAARMIPKINAKDIEFVNIAQFDERFTHFFETAKKDHQFLLNADTDFLNWRYISNPYAKYLVLAAIKNKKILGYIVVEKKYDDIHIIDITVDLKYPSTILFLIFKSLDYFKIGKLDPVVCYLGHKSYIEVLQKAGFLRDWHIECLYFKVGLLLSKINQDDFHSLDKDLFHFNGFTQYLY